MASKHVTRCSVSPTIREVQTKTISVSLMYHPLEWIHCLKIGSNGEKDVEKVDLVEIAGGNVN